MALKKYGQSESAQVFRGKEASIVNDHMRRVGKAVSEFDPNELEALNSELDTVRESSGEANAETEEPQNVVNAEVETPSVKADSKKATKKVANDDTNE